MVVCDKDKTIMNSWFSLFVVMGLSSLQATEGIKKISLPLIHDLQRADLYILRLNEEPTGLLVLSPGCNGNGKDWIQDSTWQQFAKEHKLDLVGLSFASDVSRLKDGYGYYYASQGSGQLLLDGIRQVYHRNLPMTMYGFSGGAHFTSGFVEWKPDQVRAWCAYSAEWWVQPVQNASCPPGLVACGEKDGRYGASLIYFKQGRALNKPWLWMCVPNTGHSTDLSAEKFIRDYLGVILDQDRKSVV